MKSPYKFPLRSRNDITTFLVSHQSYHPMNSGNGGYQMAWNIKVYDFDKTGKAGDCITLDRFDVKWDNWLSENDIFWQCCNDALSWYTEGDYCTSPGDDQGGYKFSVNGRSGGYLLLDDWPGPTTRRWKMAPMIFHSRGDFDNWLDELDFADLRQLYRLVVHLDQDLSDPSVHLSSAYNWQRSQLEEEWVSEEQLEADALAFSRPDMYGPAFLSQPAGLSGGSVDV